LELLVNSSTTSAASRIPASMPSAKDAPGSTSRGANQVANEARHSASFSSAASPASRDE
jgi:hypothetical protein